MGDPKFTPGPWEATSEYIIGSDVPEVHSVLNVIADADPLGAVDLLDEKIANAHLIAAAPDLYDIVASLFGLPEGADGGHICDMWEKMQHMAEKALAKARGEL